MRGWVMRRPWGDILQFTGVNCSKEAAPSARLVPRLRLGQSRLADHQREDGCYSLFNLHRLIRNAAKVNHIARHRGACQYRLGCGRAAFGL